MESSFASGTTRPGGGRTSEPDLVTIQAPNGTRRLRLFRTLGHDRHVNGAWRRRYPRLRALGPEPEDGEDITDRRMTQHPRSSDGERSQWLISRSPGAKALRVFRAKESPQNINGYSRSVFQRAVSKLTCPFILDARPVRPCRYAHFLDHEISDCTILIDSASKLLTAFAYACLSLSFLFF